MVLVEEEDPSLNLRIIDCIDSIIFDSLVMKECIGKECIALQYHVVSTMQCCTMQGRYNTVVRVGGNDKIRKVQDL